MASSKIDYRTPTATWSNWTTKKAVSDGLKSSGWVYRAVSMIAKHASSIPWVVEDANGVPIPDHPVSLLLKNPNPEFSRQGFFELLLSWQQLSGLAYAKKIIDSDGKVVELWPVSPDRLSPIPSVSASRLVDGYEELDEKGAKKKSTLFTVDNVIAFRYTDPANPIEGIGPLQVAAKAVDIDIEQLRWNKSAMQNRGILDGVFTFDRDLDPTTFAATKQRIKELFGGGSRGGNARDIGVIGSKAKYQRLSLTPAEMDFITSRRFNREEIFIIFGVPPQLAGVQDASTYNNYATSMRIFWELTLIPILDDLKDSLNFHFKDELGGLIIGYDVSEVPSLKQNHREKAEISRIYHNMGVPVKALNEMFTLGVPEYEGWDLSSLLVNDGNKDDNGNSPAASSLDGNNAEGSSDSGNSQSRSSGVDIQSTSIEIREVLSAVKVEFFDSILSKPALQRSAAIQQSMRQMKMDLLNVAEGVDTTTEHRTLSVDSIVDDTATTIIKLLLDSNKEQKTASQIRQSIEDLGVFSANRSTHFAQKMHESPSQGNL